MAIINLRDYYPFYTSDCFMEVSEEVAEMFKEFDRKEAAYRLRTYRHKAYYSLDRDDGLEHEAVFVALSPHEHPAGVCGSGAEHLFRLQCLALGDVCTHIADKGAVAAGAAHRLRCHVGAVDRKSTRLNSSHPSSSRMPSSA